MKKIKEYWVWINRASIASKVVTTESLEIETRKADQSRGYITEGVRRMRGVREPAWTKIDLWDIRKRLKGKKSLVKYSSMNTDKRQSVNG